MFRNPRENALTNQNALVKPSVGRPPSPPSTSGVSRTSRIQTFEPTMPSKVASATPKTTKNSTVKATPAKAKVPPVKALKPKGPANASILSFFKPEGLFIQDSPKKKLSPFTPESAVNSSGSGAGCITASSRTTEEDAHRYNEELGAVKRRKLSHDLDGEKNSSRSTSQTTPDAEVNGSDEPSNVNDISNAAIQLGKPNSNGKKARRPAGPFIDDSDSEEEEPITPQSAGTETKEVNSKQQSNDDADFDSRNAEPSGIVKQEENEEDGLFTPTSLEPPSLKRNGTRYADVDGFEGFEGMEDFEDEFADGEENVEKRWMREQRRIEIEQVTFEGDADEGEFDAIKDEEFDEVDPDMNIDAPGDETTAACPLCNGNLTGLSEQDSAVHVNACLDGNPIPIPTVKTEEKTIKAEIPQSARYCRPVRAAKPGQENPFMLGTANGTSSAFSKLMSSHAEDEAWAVAAAAENASRGKPAYQRTCPFYKILPGFFTCVDAFRYGAVQGCNAYFLSHFHSDHYIGLTSTWCHGPIYCSHITANLVKQQLRVDPKWVVDLEWEQRTELPGTQGVSVTMIPANHCPGSSIYLFEKEIGKGMAPKMQRVLHCGDFRACPAHVEHPLLKPDVMDKVTGKAKQQKIDVCYLDTTYLNPKYAFPSQEDVIQACADMCVSLNKTKIDDKDGWEQMKKERAGSSMANFVRVDSKGEGDAADPITAEPKTLADAQKTRGQLLVIVGTYSIGKERICLGIAKALNSKIYAPPGKQRICAALEDPELNARLTSDPRAAQVHMTPLFEIRAETLGDYLTDYRDRFSRAVGFRPSGWNYRPPGSRFTESPAVGTVLYSENWKSGYGMRDLVPQRGSTTRSSCFGVPYSEHSSFRELTMFCCALRIDRIVPTVNVGSAKSREKMKLWCDRWAVERKKNGLFRPTSGGDGSGPVKSEWFPGKGTMELRTNL